jgi:hypothetical protein
MVELVVLTMLQLTFEDEQALNDSFFPNSRHANGVNSRIAHFKILCVTRSYRQWFRYKRIKSSIFNGSRVSRKAVAIQGTPGPKKCVAPFAKSVAGIHSTR